MTKEYAGNVVMDGLDLRIEEGEFLVLLGPSGCGKTTTLRCIAGLETPDGGTLRFGGQTIFDAAKRINVPTHKRDIGMVFQSYALWPHMTVRQNVAYPLKVRRMKQEIRDGWPEKALELVRCTELAGRYPGQLSGGQQQRVALARGLVAQPRIVLMDEPLSNLDAKLRQQVRSEIKELHQELGFTAVLVTHDQDEALALGDRIAIMRDGRIEQIATPEQLFLEPATEYVATFIGLSNRVEWKRDGAMWRSTSGAQVPVARLGVEGDADRAVSCVLPDDVQVRREAPAPKEDELALRGILVTAEYGGRHQDVVVDVNGERLHARVADAWVRDLQPGDELFVAIDLRRLRSFPADAAPASDLDAAA
ncbi:ABC transporter ATP-binding protein [Microbacterium immunditiarum]|uniref:Iron(III) transport system ATP-binding protein n=1 Tax=Microbacterium immunditiarum TaxID=337480 RepID=A0A7Y9GSD9_9MICO|nr:ABC transporter ATP-binding protein [Microbacterium immunditiarum]NYE21506.1 iron(III) transport system ATP-binding protein [Microbacterium immunditiarum]